MTSFDYLSRDGTQIRGWHNDADGPAVLISNGLGTNPQAWPAIIDPTSGFRVATWYYRGTGGSLRPADPTHIRIEDHADDAIALLDQLGIEKALVCCWSLGVNIGFELAERHPDRVAGLLAVAGVPGGTFSAMLGPLRVPHAWRHTIGMAGARLLGACGPWIDTVFRVVPINRATARVISHTGFMLPSAKPEVLVAALEEFRRHDFRWYFGLAVAAGDHLPMDLEFVRCPTTLVAGRYDVITSLRAMVDAAQQIPHARLVIVPGSHFLPLERPDEMLELLRDLDVETAAVAARPPPLRRGARRPAARGSGR